MLAVVAGLGLLDGLNLDGIATWRQLLFVVLAVAAYLTGRHLPVRRGWLVLAVAATCGAVRTVPDFWTGAGALMALGVFVVLPWVTGRFRRQQAELATAAQERVTRLEREQELVADRARLRERARIASDMHDSLGHELALIALRAGALELTADVPEHSREAVAQLRAAAVAATDRLRDTVGVLRQTGTSTAGSLTADAPTEPPDESVDALVRRARDAGMTIVLHDSAPASDLPPLVERAVHRVVQESLTNAARHAPGTDVLVSIERTAETVTATVRNSATHAAAIQVGGESALTGESEPTGGRGLGGGNGLGGGSGLDGLQERVRLVGGTLRAGPQPGGFAVTAYLPTSRDRAGEHR